MEYSAVLQHYMDKAGVSQSELAHRIGRPTSSINDLLRGRSKTPSVYKAKDIAVALGVPLGEMLAMMFDEDTENQAP